MDEQFISLIIKAAVLLICTVITSVVVPWIKTSTRSAHIKTFVQAADKMARTGQIASSAKFEYVEALLESVGVEMSPMVKAEIESAVTELDMALKKVAEAAAEE